MNTAFCRKFRRQTTGRSRLISDEAKRSGSVHLPSLPDLKPEKKERLNMFFDDIIGKVVIDFDNQEIQDLQSAVLTMLDRIKERMNERNVFNISYIQPCGSISEKTAIWKWDKSTRKSYTEFDFLAVLKTSTDDIVGNDCLGCLKVTKQPVNLERLKTLYTEIKHPVYINNYIGDISVLNSVFIQEILKSVSSSCDCLSLQFKECSFEGLFRKFSIAASGKDEALCENCVVRMPTGTLRVNTSVTIDINTPPMNCSLVFLWESNTGSLMAPVDFLLNKIEPVRSLTIYVDFIPALEILRLDSSKGVLKLEHDIFVVPKRCAWRNTCENRCVDGVWRTSSCLSEIKAIMNFGEKHRKCYKILKFLCQAMSSSYKFGFYPVNRYHVKIIAINHSVSCSNPISKTCVDCVMEMLYELESAYKNTRQPVKLQQSVIESGSRDNGSSALHSLLHGCGQPSFEGTRFQNLISSLCTASQCESKELFLKNLISFES